jgi:hypothetical protein
VTTLSALGENEFRVLNAFNYCNSSLKCGFTRSAPTAQPIQGEKIGGTNRKTKINNSRAIFQRGIFPFEHDFRTHTLKALSFSSGASENFHHPRKTFFPSFTSVFSWFEGKIRNRRKVFREKEERVKGNLPRYQTRTLLENFLVFSENVKRRSSGIRCAKWLPLNVFSVISRRKDFRYVWFAPMKWAKTREGGGEELRNSSSSAEGKKICMKKASRKIAFFPPKRVKTERKTFSEAEFAFDFCLLCAKFKNVVLLINENFEFLLRLSLIHIHPTHKKNAFGVSQKSNLAHTTIHFFPQGKFSREN